eukprot:4049709-Amphidinium_carterae.4
MNAEGLYTHNRAGSEICHSVLPLALRRKAPVRGMLSDWSLCDELLQNKGRRQVEGSNPTIRYSRRPGRTSEKDVTVDILNTPGPGEEKDVADDLVWQRLLIL